jgi:hypothetical protein
MRRRTFLATGAVLATAGCLGRTGTGGDDATTTNSDGADCPAVHGGTEATVCTGATGDYPVSFTQRADRVPVGGTLAVALVNDTAAAVGLNPYDWAVYHLTGGASKPVDRGAVVEPWVVLEAGDRVRWRVGAGDSADPDTSPDDVYGGALPLESGQRYAFAISVAVDDAEPADDDRTVFVAPFTVE